MSNESTQFKPGQSGNPRGRPKGSKNKLATEFIDALANDFTQHGKDVIEKIRIDKPIEYAKIIATIIPKDIFIEADVDASVKHSGLSEVQQRISQLLSS